MTYDNLPNTKYDFKVDYVGPMSLITNTKCCNTVKFFFLNSKVLKLNIVISTLLC